MKETQSKKERDQGKEGGKRERKNPLTSILVVGESFHQLVNGGSFDEINLTVSLLLFKHDIFFQVRLSKPDQGKAAITHASQNLSHTMVSQNTMELVGLNSLFD